MLLHCKMESFFREADFFFFEIMNVSVQHSFIANWKASTTYIMMSYRDIQSHDMSLK